VQVFLPGSTDLKKEKTAIGEAIISCCGHQLSLNAPMKLSPVSVVVFFFRCFGWWSMGVSNYNNNQPRIDQAHCPRPKPFVPRPWQLGNMSTVIAHRWSFFVF